MARLSTMGTASCATMAIGYFKYDKIEDNELYLHEGKRKEYINDHDVDWWLDEILTPLEQELGQTDSVPFDQLMDDIEEDDTLNRKFCICTLNAFQHDTNGYWKDRLIARGFRHFHTTKNNMGGINYLYLRDPAEVK